MPTRPATLWIYAQHCVNAGQEVHPDRVADYVEQWGCTCNDWVAVEATEEEAARFHAMLSPYGWRVARLIRDELGTTSGESNDTDEDDDK
jgi:hypothetical protein